jgi:hypothetical protein
MKRSEIVNLLTDVQSGRLTKAAIRKAIEMENEKLIRRNPSLTRAIELAELLEPKFTTQREALFVKVNRENEKLYGRDLDKWPDEALEAGLAPYRGNVVYDRLWKCYNEPDFREFVKWAEDLLTQKNNGQE